MDVSRELYLEHGWKMPSGMTKTQDADPRNFTLAQWQQAKRQKKDPRAIKETFQDSWAISDSGPAFANALEERGYYLARGDKKFVALDIKGEIYAVSKWVGVKERQAREKLSTCTNLPDVETARRKMAAQMAQRLETLANKEQSIILTRIKLLQQQRIEMKRKHQETLETMRSEQQKRAGQEARDRQARHATGLHGLVQSITGRRQHIKETNEREAYLAFKRDQEQRDALIYSQIEERRNLEAHSKQMDTYAEQRKQAMSVDKSQYETMKQGQSERFEPSPTVEKSNEPKLNP